MSRLEAARLAQSSKNRLLLLLCIALIAWRIDFRIEQYQASGVGASSSVAFFDANERNIATLHEANSSLHARVVALQPHLISGVANPAFSLIQLTDKDQPWPGTPPAVFRSFDCSVSLLPNPPPARLV